MSEALSLYTHAFPAASSWTIAWLAIVSPASAAFNVEYAPGVASHGNTWK